MNKIFSGLIAFIAMISGTALAQWAVVDPAATEESSFYGRLDLTYQAAKDKEGGSVFGKLFYGEYKLSETFAATVSGYHDRGYWEFIPGVAKQITEDLQLGVGVGVARYDDRNWAVVNPWAYYAKGNVKALLFAEYYPKEFLDKMNTGLVKIAFEWISSKQLAGT